MSGTAWRCSPTSPRPAKPTCRFPTPAPFASGWSTCADEKVRERLRLIWTQPAALDPALQSADVTREISAHLAELAKSLEEAGHGRALVADFLTPLPVLHVRRGRGAAARSAASPSCSIRCRPTAAAFQELVEQLFREMNSGTGKGISIVLRKKLLQFNGGLFSDFTVLPVNGLQLGLLKEAAKQNWSRVEPAIFGTLLERALNPAERHKLGAHYTPRAYVERLVLPTRGRAVAGRVGERPGGGVHPRPGRESQGRARRDQRLP